MKCHKLVSSKLLNHMLITLIKTIMLKSFILLLFTFSLFGCLKSSDQLINQSETVVQSETKNYVPDDSYAVYSALLNDNKRDEKSQFIIIEDIYIDNIAVEEFKTKFPIDLVLRNIKLDIPIEFKPALSDYKLKNKEVFQANTNDLSTSKLKRFFNLETNYQIVRQEDINSLFKGEDVKLMWKTFYEKYPNSGGYIKFSKVGFDQEKEHAFVYMELNCQALCGQGGYFLLKKDNGSWKKSKQSMLWFR